MNHRSNLTEYRNDDGRVLNFYQLAMQSVKEGKDVPPTEDGGYLIDGEHFTPIASDNTE